MREFKIGDRVKCLGFDMEGVDVEGMYGVCEEIRVDSPILLIIVRLANSPGRRIVYPSQLRHLKPKKPRLECYVNVYPKNEISKTACYSRMEAGSRAGPSAIEVGVRMVRAKDQKHNKN